MEAAPRLPMIGFDLKTSVENVTFGPYLKHYIASHYQEDSETYDTEISNLESLRGAAVRPSVELSSLQVLKKYYCQLAFLKSRFPMGEQEAAAVNFSWKDPYSGVVCAIQDVMFEMASILYNIGALHTQLGAVENRINSDDMKMTCTHFQCAAWSFQNVLEQYHQQIIYSPFVDVIQFMIYVCLAQAQECILEKSMLDNRKPTIIAKVAVHVVHYYKKAMSILKSDDESAINDLIGSKTCQEWLKYLNFKIAYNECMTYLFQGQQAEEQQKMGERVAFYQAASEHLNEVRKLSTKLKTFKEIEEALSFTGDVVEGKKKAAVNENEFIYHEEVPDVNRLPKLEGASLVKGIPFSINDVEVSGPDIFARLVPLEVHEASSMYSEKKALLLREIGEKIEYKDQTLTEVLSTMELDVVAQMRQAIGLPKEVIDRHTTLIQRPTVCQDLLDVMTKVANSSRDVQTMLTEINELLLSEDHLEKSYQEVMGKRPPSNIITELTRESTKYRDAHIQADDSNQNLHKAITTNIANLKVLSQTLTALKEQIPEVELPNELIDEKAIQELDTIYSKVEEMRLQRAMLWSQLREAVHQDDITTIIVTNRDVPLNDIFQQQLDKHQQMIAYLEKNMEAQENIIEKLNEIYNSTTDSRRYLNEIISKRKARISALIVSFDTYEDLFTKANKGIVFYTKLETNVSKLLQRTRSACKVQQEEREQMLTKNSVTIIPSTTTHTTSISINNNTSNNTTPKLKDYLDSRKKLTTTTPNTNMPQQSVTNSGSNPENQTWPSGVRPTPVGSEINTDQTQNTLSNETNKGFTYSHSSEQDLALRLRNLRTESQNENPSVYHLNSIQYGTTNKPDKSYFNVQNPYRMTDNNYANYSFKNTNLVQPSNNNYAVIQTPLPMNNSYVSNVTISSTINPAPNVVTVSTTLPMMSSTYSTPQYPYNPNTYFTSVPHPTLPQSKESLYQIPYQTNPQIPTMQNYNDPNKIHPGYQSGTIDNNKVSVHHQIGVPPNIYHQAPISGNFQVPNTVLPSVQSNSYGTGAILNQNTVVPQNDPTYHPAGYYNTQINQSTTNPSSTYQPQVSYGIAEPNKTRNENVTSLPQMVSGTTQVNQSTGSIYSTPTASSNYYSNPSYTVVPNPLQTNTYYNQTVSQPSVPIVSKSSNVDLLSDIDFSVKQVPLVPQKKSELDTTSTTMNAATTTITANVSNGKTSIEQSTSTTIVSVKIHRKPLRNNDVQKLFLKEVSTFEEQVNELITVRSKLDQKWKELQEKQDTDKLPISVARCYPNRNRFCDILPYDATRVELKNTRDDYINASFLRNISLYAPQFIATQAPMLTTFTDFWSMVAEQGVELVVCLLGPNEIEDVYWPKDKDSRLTFNDITLSVISENVKPFWIERLLSLQLSEKRNSRVIVHLQYTVWPGSLFPISSMEFVEFAKEILQQCDQQRNPDHPILIHCASGTGRTGALILLLITILEATNNPHIMPDLIQLTHKLNMCIKNILYNREFLKFTYEAMLTYMHYINDGQYRKLNEPVAGGGKGEINEKDDSKSTIKDPLNDLDPFWVDKRNLEKGKCESSGT